MDGGENNVGEWSAGEESEKKEEGKIKSLEAGETEWRLMFPAAEKLLRLVYVAKSAPCLIWPTSEERLLVCCSFSLCDCISHYPLTNELTFIHKAERQRRWNFYQVKF